LNNGEIHAVFHTAVSAQNAQTPGDVVGSSHMPFWKWSISHKNVFRKNHLPRTHLGTQPVRLQHQTKAQRILTRWETGGPAILGISLNAGSLFFFADLVQWAVGPITFKAAHLSDVTHILSQIESGDPSAADLLLPLVYEELRKLAAEKMAKERTDHTLQATALVHEAYVRLVKEENCHWNSRGHFFSAAAEAMRRILIEAARHKRALKEGGQHQKIAFTDLSQHLDNLACDLIDLDEALARFESLEPQKAQLIKLRFFAGLSIDQAAATLGISVATAKRQWVYARAWLYGAMNGPDSPGAV
jgi:RNA polymerase sigma factor (TIGR02999 family)